MWVVHKPYPVARPAELVPVPKEMTRNTEKIYVARPSALTAFDSLIQEARTAGTEIILISSHRTFEYQKTLFERAEAKHGRGKGVRWLAPPGYSEHHTGYVFDLADRAAPETDDEETFEGTAAFSWLLKNAGRFGFEMSFPRGNWQNVGYEPWHWRFAGDPHSKSLFHPPLFGRCLGNSRAVLNSVQCAIRTIV
jgi:D-alanyl-D-alanine carboxypeptidase